MCILSTPVATMELFPYLFV